jgi:hypothetical protein
VLLRAPAGLFRMQAMRRIYPVPTRQFMGIMQVPMVGSSRG